MKTPVKVLLLEDSEADGLLLACELERGGYTPEIERVWTGPKLDAALQDRNWDIIISDFNMPGFNAFEGLAVLKKSGRDIPFVVVSGTIGEERAVAAMKAGAADYVPKGNSNRLIPVIQRELAQARERQLQRVTQQTDTLVEGNFRGLVEKSIAAICVIQDDRFVYVNPRVSQILGYAALELTSSLFLDSVFADDRDMLQANIQTRFAGEVKSITCSLRMLRKDGSSLPIEVYATRTEYNGRPSILCTLTEITRQRDVAEPSATIAKSMRNQRMECIGSLAGGIAHDLNNSFASILMTVEMLRATKIEPEATRMLDVLQTSAQRGAGMVGQILTFARGIEGKKSALQLRHLIAEIVAMARQTFPKTIRIKQMIQRDLWPVSGDSTQLHQAILNLCINARDAMPEGGTLTMSAENSYLDEVERPIHPDAKAGVYTTLSVSDTGPGIPLHVQARMFDPFFTTKEPGHGTGLGLSTVRNILKNHNGFVTFETAEAKGTRFKVYLPAESGSKTSVENVRALLPRGHGQRILVVDDEVVIRDIAQQFLQTFGYEVFTARNGPEAVVVCAKNLGRIEVMLTDLMMPVMDGSATIEAVRSIDPNIKVIVANEEILTEQTKRGISATAQAVLQKPYTPEKLLHTIHEVLQKSGPMITPK